MSENYSAAEPERSEMDALRGPAVIEFGTEWCGYCRAVQPIIEPLFAQHSQIKHFKIEDGPGRPLGRSFGIKSWPTFIFLRDGKELSRLVRPTNPSVIRDALEQIDPSAE